MIEQDSTGDERAATDSEKNAFIVTTNGVALMLYVCVFLSVSYE